jgi:hypothetical protein
VEGNVEGFYRPKKNGYYSLLPVPILGVELSRVRHVLYICAHVDNDPQKTHLTIYMMTGYRIDDLNIKNFLLDVLVGPSLEVKPAGLSLFGLTEIRKKVLFWLDWSPVFRFFYDALDGVQRIASNLIGDFTGVGVERITLTLDRLELAGGIDLKKPNEKPRLVKNIYFKE